MFKYRLPAYANTIKQLRLFYLAAHSEGLHAHTLKCTPRIKASHKNESRSFEVSHTLLHSTHVRRALQQQFCSQCSGKPLPCHCQSQHPHSSHTLRVHCSGAQLLLEVSRTFVLIQKSLLCILEALYQEQAEGCGSVIRIKTKEDASIYTVRH